MIYSALKKCKKEQWTWFPVGMGQKSYEERLEELKMTTLEARRGEIMLTEMFKIMSGLGTLTPPRGSCRTWRRRTPEPRGWPPTRLRWEYRRRGWTLEDSSSVWRQVIRGIDYHLKWEQARAQGSLKMPIDSMWEPKPKLCKMADIRDMSYGRGRQSYHSPIGSYLGQREFYTKYPK